MRRLSFIMLSLLVVSLMFLTGGMTSAAPVLGGTLDRGTNTNGEGYLLFSFSALSDITGLTVTMTAGTDYIGVFAADAALTPAAKPRPALSVPAKPLPVANGARAAANTPLPFDDSPPWHLIGSRTYSENGVAKPTATFTFSAKRTYYLLILARHFDASGAPTPVSMTATGQVVGALIPTDTPTASGGTGTPAAQCHDLGDGAVDQHGVSVDVWAPGLRQACGFLGYENGDNPMPSGTPFDAPRPFRFDYTYDHNEVVYGFKVFYWNGDADHCGDMRAIVHQGGDVHGISTRFHTFQFAIALCDGARNKHIIDVGGQADTGSLILESRPSDPIGETGNGASRFTADIESCSGRPTPREGCYTRWYPSILFEVPGGGPDGSTGIGGATVEFQVDRPITLADPNNLQRVVLTNNLGVSGWDGVSRTVSEWLVFNLKSGNQSTWWTTWDANQQRQVIVPAGTPGAWRMRMDGGISPRGDGVNIANCEAGFGCDKRTHANPTSGIVYPN